MRITQFFTGHGFFGALLFVLGSLLSFAGWTMTGASLPLLNRLLPNMPLAFVIIGLLMATVSIPMMIVGRGYDVKIDRIPKDKIF